MPIVADIIYKELMVMRTAIEVTIEELVLDTLSLNSTKSYEPKSIPATKH